MTPDLEALARRAIACKGWRWMAGMRLLDGDLVIAVSGDGLPIAASPAVLFGVPPTARKDALPDLSDPATLGCLLALVREAHGSPLLRVEGFPDGWRAVRTDRAPYVVGLGHSEAAALVAALEAAP